MKDNLKDREFDKFRPAEEGQSKVAVEVENSKQIPVTTLGVKWDSLQVNFPDPVQDEFVYFYQGSPVLTVLVEYETSSKRQIVSITKS